MSNDHLVDSKIRLGKCNRCENYVFMAMSSGIRSAADPAPATRDAYIAALTDGRRTFHLLTQAGRPHKLLTRRLSTIAPAFTPEGAQRDPEELERARRGALPATLVEHGCGGHQRNMLTFTEVAPAPTATVCETWQASGWVPPPGKCGRARNPTTVSCPTCDSPPF